MNNADFEGTIDFKTHHGDLSVVAAVLAVMAPDPPTGGSGTHTEPTMLVCEVGPDGLWLVLGTSAQPCRVRMPLVASPIQVEAARFHLPARILRMAAAQRPKQDKPRRRKADRTQRRMPSSAFRPREPNDVHDGPMSWMIVPHESRGQLTFGTFTFHFASPPVILPPEREVYAQGEVRAISPESLRGALLAARPAAGRDREDPPNWCQVEIVDGQARAANKRMYAVHQSSSLTDLRLRIACADIGTLTALMAHLDRTATILRSQGDLIVMDDGRLSVGFRQPREPLPFLQPIESLPRSLYLDCAADKFKQILDLAQSLIPTGREARDGLQVQLQLVLNEDGAVLRASGIWEKNVLQRHDIGVMMTPEQVRAVRERLSHGPRTDVDIEPVDEVPEPPTPITASLAAAASGDTETTCESVEASEDRVFELGRYPFAELVRAAVHVRAALLRLEFIDAKAIVLSVTANDYSTTYLIPARAEDTMPGLPGRRSTRKGGPM